MLVHCGPATGKHTAVLIAEKLDTVVTSLDLEPEMFTSMTTDNAVNMLNAVSKESRTIQQGLGCIDHPCDLVVEIRIGPKLTIEFGFRIQIDNDSLIREG